MPRGETKTFGEVVAPVLAYLAKRSADARKIALESLVDRVKRLGTAVKRGPKAKKATFATAKVPSAFQAAKGAQSPATKKKSHKKQVPVQGAGENSDQQVQ